MLPSRSEVCPHSAAREPWLRQGGGRAGRRSPRSTASPQPWGHRDEIAAVCGDAVSRIDELSEVTQRLLEELGLGGPVGAPTLLGGSSGRPGLDFTPAAASAHQWREAPRSLDLLTAQASRSQLELPEVAPQNLCPSGDAWRGQLTASQQLATELGAAHERGELCSVSEGVGGHVGHLTASQQLVTELATPARERRGFCPASEVVGRLAASRQRAAELAAPAPECTGLYPVSEGVSLETEAALSPERSHLSLAEEWVASYRPPPLVGCRGVAYPGGTTVLFGDFAQQLAPVARANVAQRARTIEAVESGDSMRLTFETYQAFDSERSGCLGWGRGVIRDFVFAVFQQCGLSAPSEGAIYPVYALFDQGRQMVLQACDCLCLADALLRASLALEVALPAGATALREEAAATARAALMAADPGASQPDAQAAHFSIATPRLEQPARGACGLGGDQTRPPPMVGAGGAFAVPELAGARRSGAATEEALSAGPKDPPDAPALEPPAQKSKGNVYAAHGLKERATAHPTELAEQWVASYQALPVEGTANVAYSTGVVVSFADLSGLFAPLAEANAGRARHMVEAIESGEFMRTALSIYKGLDQSGYLSWAGGGILGFVVEVFRHYSLRPPSGEEVLPLHAKFDQGRGAMNTGECLCLLDALARTVFHQSAGSAEALVSAESRLRHGRDPAAGMEAMLRAGDDIDAMVREHARLLEQAESRAWQADRLAHEEADRRVLEAERRAREEAARTLRVESARRADEQEAVRVAGSTAGVSIATATERPVAEPPPSASTVAELGPGAGWPPTHSESHGPEVCVAPPRERRLTCARPSVPCATSAHPTALAGERDTGHQLTLAATQEASAPGVEAGPEAGTGDHWPHSRDAQPSENCGGFAAARVTPAPASPEVGFPPAAGHVSPSISYAGGAHFEPSEFAEVMRQFAAANAGFAARIVPMIEDGRILRLAQQVYWECDQSLAGALSWRGGEVLSFVGRLFERLGLVPPEAEQAAALFERFDAGRRGRLDAGECVDLADALFRCAFAPAASGAGEPAAEPGPERPSPGEAPPAERPPSPDRGQQVPPADLVGLLERWVADYAAPAVCGTASLKYAGRVPVIFAEMAVSLVPVAIANATRRAEAIRAIESGDTMRSALRAYTARDVERRGVLPWADGRILDLVVAVFKEHGFVPPTQSQVSEAYSLFDPEGVMHLDAQGCLFLVDALLRSAFCVSVQTRPRDGPPGSAPSSACHSPAGAAAAPVAAADAAGGGASPPMAGSCQGGGAGRQGATVAESLCPWLVAAKGTERGLVPELPPAAAALSDDHHEPRAAAWAAPRA